MSVTVKRVDRKSSQRFYELIVETEEGVTRGASFKNEREIRSGASPVSSMNS